MKITKEQLKQIIKEEIFKVLEAYGDGVGGVATAFGKTLGDLRMTLSKNPRMRAAADEIERQGLWTEYEAIAQQLSRDRPDKFLEPQIYLNNLDYFRKLYPNLASNPDADVWEE